MNVSLTPELESFVRGKVQGGQYSSVNEVVREALRLLQERDMLGGQQLDELHDRVDAGLASLTRGEGADGESFMQDLLETVNSNKDKRKAG